MRFGTPRSEVSDPQLQRLTRARETESDYAVVSYYVHIAPEYTASASRLACARSDTVKLGRREGGVVATETTVAGQ